MNKPKRTRLSPEQRRSQLLDVTQSLILEYGLNSFTMEILAKAAGVSNPLVYKYFDTRLELLQSLLLREYQRYHDHWMQEFSKTSNFDEMLKMLVSINFDDYFNNGNILPILQSQADVEVILKPIQSDNPHGQFLVAAVKKNFSLSYRQARILTVMASGASIAAAEHHSKFGGNREQMIADAVHFISSAMASFLPTASQAQ